MTRPLLPRAASLVASSSSPLRTASPTTRPGEFRQPVALVLTTKGCVARDRETADHRNHNGGSLIAPDQELKFVAKFIPKENQWRVLCELPSGDAFIEEAPLLGRAMAKATIGAEDRL